MSFRVFEHTADIGLDVEAADLVGLFTDAARALFSVVRGDNRVAPERRFEVEAKAGDLERLLVGFLNEFVFLMDAQGVVFHDVQDVHVTKRGGAWEAVATVTGEAFSHERHPGCLHVKAVTRHAMDVSEPGRGEGARARLILDV